MHLHLAALVSLVVLALGPGRAVAQALPEDYAAKPYEQHRVAVIPRVPFYLDPEAPAVEGLDFQRVSRALEDHFREQPYFLLTPPLEIYTALQASEVRARLIIASDRQKQGLQHFYNLDYVQAIETLEDALGLYHNTLGEGSDNAHILGELLAPTELAAVHQHLAFSHLELEVLSGEGEVASPRMLAITNHLIDLVRLAPELQLDPARNPPARIQLYTQARRELLANRQLRDQNVEEARLLSRLLDVDFLVFGRVVQGAEGELVLEVQIYERASDAFRYEKSQLLGTDSNSAAERADALLSRFTSCVSPRPTPPELVEGDAGHVYFDVGTSYYQFLDSPTDSPFDNIGASFSGTYMVTDYFGVVARMTLIFSGNNRQGDLLTTFTTFRGIIGAQGSYSWKYFRPFLQGGLELAKATPFTASTDVRCKAFGINDEAGECGSFNTFDIALLVGFNVALGFNVGYDPLYLTLQTSFAFYFFPFEEGKEINFPTGLTAALTYRF